MTRHYVGTKLIQAWESPADKDYGQHKAGSPGYGVRYQDGYTSWSPKEVFEAAYLCIGDLDASIIDSSCISPDIVERFIVNYETCDTESSVTVFATLANRMLISQTVTRSMLSESPDEWHDLAVSMAAGMIGVEVTKYLNFLLACAQNGICLMPSEPKAELENPEA
ncbi:MAG: hypothetical protein AAF329_18890 [Cyanobacteria bacterium P01_A01_bin.17]